MMSEFRKIRPFGLSIPVGGMLLAAVLFAAGCSTANSPSGSGGSGTNHVDASGRSIPGWVALPAGGAHAPAATLDYVANGSSSCADCHGADLSGGISRVSCYQNPAGCHHGPVTGWATPQVHGATAKLAPGSSGFASCQICHGAGFDGVGSQVSCFDCHGVSAPHPAAPWLGGTFTHATTNPANAAVCVRCHFPGSPNNPANHPAAPAPAGTAPDCFNNTLCHGAATPHPVGATWVATSPAAQPHGNDAKAAPGASTGLAYCQACHGTGTDFAGGTSGTSCYPCHGANAPHPSQWRTGDIYVHTSADEGNAAVCAFCHTDGANSPIAPPSPPAPSGTAPGCFNSTLCHGAIGFHPDTWPAVGEHGAAAKAAPTPTGGFLYCQTCHGTGSNFSGGSTGVSCYTCHGVSAPHPAGATWVTSAAPSHRSTNSGNAAACALCHQSNAGTPGCFNNTLCH